MKIIVVGAGVIGVTSAWYLAKAGHQVVVMDRQPAPGRETSFANAGEVSPGYSAPWAAPGIPLKALKWMFQRHAPLVVQPKPDLAKLTWLARMLSNCTPNAYAINKARMVRLAEYSRDSLAVLREETGIAYDERTQGTLQLFRTQAQIEAAEKDIAVLREGGVLFEVLDEEGCLRAEPGLAGARGPIAGGLRLPGDETGDCFKFTTALADLAAATGVEFHYSVTVDRLLLEDGRVRGVVTAGGQHRADAVVVALGSYSPALVRPLGIALPVYPVKGYSLTLPVIDQNRAPASTVMDETHKVAITRLGDRIRVGGAGRDRGLRPVTAPVAPCDASSFHGGPVRRRRGREPGGVLVRAAAHDAGWNSRHWADAGSGPPSQHRARYAGVDHGRRVRSSAGRHRVRPQDRHRDVRLGHQPVRAADFVPNGRAASRAGLS